MSEPWERRPGETPRQYEAFTIYMGFKPHERSVPKVQGQLGLKSNRHLYRWSSKHDWPERSGQWDDEQARVRRLSDNDRLRTMSERHYNVADGMLGILSLHMQQAFQELKKKVAENPEGTLDYLDAKLVPSWLKAIVEAQRTSLGQPIILPVDAETERAKHWGPLDVWRQQYVHPPGTFTPHRLQREAINSTARFLAMVCGVQSGKTTGGAIGYWNRILKEVPELRKRGEKPLYWLVAPNSVIGRVMQQAFVAFAPEGQILKTKGAESNRTWELACGAKVEFRSAQNPESLVAAPVNGVWLDEFTLMDHRVWTVSLRQRLAKTEGWAIFTGTPRGRNWAWEEIWRRCDPNDDKYDSAYESFTWPSRENPAISQDEVAAAQRQLPEAYFRREWEASWEAFHGQIYEAWNRTRHFVKGLRELIPPPGSRYFMGVDWGHANPGALVVGRWLATGEWHIVEEVHVAGKLPSWWHARITEAWRMWRIEKIYCDPEDPGRIAELCTDGLPAVKANNSLHEGIRTVAALYKQNRLLVDDTCKVLANQTGDYHWQEDSKGNRRELPVKGNDHGVDAKRYMIHSAMTEPKPGERRTWGTGGKRKKK